MILGRSTQQWLGLISAALALLLTILGAAAALGWISEDMLTFLTVTLGAIGTFLGVLVAFIANTYTTPVADPQLKEGTMVRVTDETGTVVDHRPI